GSGGVDGAHDGSGGGADGGGGGGDGGGGGGADGGGGGGGGIVSGGPCASGALGATAMRVHFINAGGSPQTVYDVDGLPDKTRWHVAAYGYQIGFTPQYVDPFLGSGGLLLDSSDFVDVELSTSQVSQITSATLAIYGRSFDTTTSGSFEWQ